MALQTLVLVLVMMAFTEASERQMELEEIYEDNGIMTSATYHKENIMKRNFNLSLLLQKRSDTGTCGVPDPKCTTDCSDESGCSCRLPTGLYSYYIFPCKENDKICKEGEHELFDYSKIHPSHSAALLPNHQCNKIRQGVSNEEKQQILDTHNNLRAKVARGEEHRSPQQGVPQPGGSNIRELIWNEELAYIAQKWADQCKFEHESPSSRRAPCSEIYEYVGQNLYMSWGTMTNIASQWPHAITAWYDEVADTPTSLVNHYAWGVTTKMIGHYTQLVWGDTYEVGCGAVYYSGSKYGSGSTTIYVCNYGPGGNIIDGKMYNTGKPASECGESGKSTKYPGLCATKH